MVNNKIGYACINMQLSYPTKYGNKPRGTERITTNRSMIRRTFDEKGVDYASEICLQNVKDLHEIVAWNITNGYDFFHICTYIFNWFTCDFTIHIRYAVNKVTTIIFKFTHVSFPCY